MTKTMFVIACWCTGLVGMNAPVAKKYNILVKAWEMQDMRRAYKLEQVIREQDAYIPDTEEIKSLIHWNKEEIVVRLLKKNVLHPTFDILEEAIAYKRNVLAILFLDMVKNLVQEIDSKGTVLHIASLYNNVEIAKKALELGIDINVVNQYSDTPLHLAARQGYQDMVAFLCDRGANPFTLNERKFNKRFDAMDIAYRRMERIYRVTDVQQDTVARKQRYCDILHIMYKYVEKFGGSARTFFVQ